MKIDITPPAVRFIRCFDPLESRMRNIWQTLSTQEQIDAYPRATEVSITSTSVESALAEIRKLHWVNDSEFEKIKEAAKQITPSLDPTYEVRNV